MKGLVIAGTVFLLAFLIWQLWSWIDFRRKVNSKLEESVGFLELQSTGRGFRKRLLAFLDYSNHVMEEEYALKLMNQKAELETLQSQINPHFLYNTLDTIRGKAYEENAVEIADMAERLALLFRYVIGQQSGLIALEEEIANIENYIYIQQYRFRMTLELIREIEDPGLLEYRIPKLTLQPLIENTFKYGFAGRRENNVIRVQAYRTQSRTIIRISDNGKGMPVSRLQEINRRLTERGPGSVSESGKEKGNGIALGNVNARIKLIYGREYGLVVYSIENEGTTIEIMLPGAEDDHEDRKTESTEFEPVSGK